MPYPAYKLNVFAGWRRECLIRPTNLMSLPDGGVNALSGLQNMWS